MEKQVSIGLLLYPGVQLAAVHGLSDLFFTANRIAVEKSPRTASPLHLSHWQVGAGSGKSDSGTVDIVEASENNEQNSPTQLTVVIVTPNLESRGTDIPAPILLDWLKTQHQGGAILCSVCTAAFILARTGLLDGRPVTTHWALKETLAAQFPRIRVQTEQMVIEDGEIITAGGVTAWMDLGLRLIDRFLGPSVMLEVAQFFLVDPSGREQRAYSKFLPQFNHGDDAILAVQHWLQTHYTNPISIADMASVAVLGERTFLRRFKKTTGINPTAYLQALRVGKAREMLEFSQRSFREIAWEVGYEDQSGFRKVFQRMMGLTPSEYRRRFAVRGKTRPSGRHQL